MRRATRRDQRLGKMQRVDCRSCSIHAIGFAQPALLQQHEATERIVVSCALADQARVARHGKVVSLVQATGQPALPSVRALLAAIRRDHNAIEHAAHANPLKSSTARAAGRDLSSFVACGSEPAHMPATAVVFAGGLLWLADALHRISPFPTTTHGRTFRLLGGFDAAQAAVIQTTASVAGRVAEFCRRLADDIGSSIPRPAQLLEKITHRQAAMACLDPKLAAGWPEREPRFRR